MPGVSPDACAGDSTSQPARAQLGFLGFLAMRMVKAANVIYHGKVHPSALVLPVVP